MGRGTRPCSSSIDEQSFASPLEPLVHTDQYEADIVFESASHSIGTTAYPEYPIRIVENDDRWVCLEGHIYGRDDEALEWTVTVK